MELMLVTYRNALGFMATPNKLLGLSKLYLIWIYIYIYIYKTNVPIYRVLSIV